MIYLPWIIFGLGCAFLIWRGFQAKRKEPQDLKRYEKLIDQVEWVLCCVPAEQPNCEICDKAMKLIDDFRDEQAERGQ